MTNRKKGRPQSFPPHKRWCMFCTEEEVKILRAALKRRRAEEKEKEKANALKNSQ